MSTKKILKNKHFKFFLYEICIFVTMWIDSHFNKIKIPSDESAAFYDGCSWYTHLPHQPSDSQDL